MLVRPASIATGTLTRLASVALASTIYLPGGRATTGGAVAEPTMPKTMTAAEMHLKRLLTAQK